MTLPGSQTTQSKANQANNNLSTLDIKTNSTNVSPEASPRGRRDAAVAAAGQVAAAVSCSTTPPLAPGRLCTDPSPVLDNAPSISNNPDFNCNVKVESLEATDNKEAVPSLASSSSKESVSSSSSKSGTRSAAPPPSPIPVPPTDGRESRQKKKVPWYSSLSLNPTYKSRSDDFKRIFKSIPPEERLVVDYSCAIQRDILIHGRLYVSQNYLCFYANIFRWETQVVLPWKEVTAVTKEKTALVIPNAILVRTKNDNYFFTSFGARDKTYIMLFRVWQSSLIDVPISLTEIFQWVRSCYGDELGLTSDDDDYVNMNAEESITRSLQSYSEESLSVSVSMSDGIETSGDQISGDIHDNGGSCGQDENVSSAQEGSLPPIDNNVQDSAQDNLAQEGSGPPPKRSPSDLLPTDLSDDSSLSESESEKHGEIVICPLKHEGKLMLHMQVAIHVDQLFTHLFTNSKFFSDLHETRKTTDVKHSPWIMNPSTNQKDRTVSLTVSLAQSVGPKQAQVTESQKMLPCSKPGEMYAIEIETSNAGIPYADTFFIARHYCLTRAADPNTSTIAVYCQIKYRKSVWGIVKTFIEKNCWSGLEDYYATLVKALEEECERTRAAVAARGAGRVRRRRRSISGEAEEGPSEVETPPPPAFPPAVRHIPYPPSALVPSPPVPMPLPPRPTHDPLALLVFFALLLLLVINAALYYKLWGLEQAHADMLSRYSPHHSPIDLTIFSEKPETASELRNLLAKQEELHTEHVNKWVAILKAAVSLLQEVEKSLTALQNTIQGVVGDEVFATSAGARVPDEL